MPDTSSCTMQWTSCLSTAAETSAAAEEVIARASVQLGATPDLVFVFASRHHRPEFGALPGLLQRGLGNAPLLGCGASGVIGAGREIEDEPALAVVAAHLPGVVVAPFHLEPQGVPPPGTATASWDARLGLPDATAPDFVVMPDPFTCRAGDFVRALDEAYPQSTVVGGMASGGTEPGDSALFFGSETHAGGVVGVALVGNVSVDAVVAQGCRPVGSPMFVTRGAGNIVHELDGRTPSDVLQELYRTLPGRDQGLMRTALHLGLVINRAQEVYRHGDFLVRNIVALDGDTGAMAVGANIETGQVVQFHVRDSASSDEDLNALLSEHCGGEVGPAGALMFACMGRGVGLFGEADHDSHAFAAHAGPVPLGGFFCNGEIGPVGGNTHLHSYTSSFALFRRRRSD